MNKGRKEGRKEGMNEQFPKSVTVAVSKRGICKLNIASLGDFLLCKFWVSHF